MYTKLSKNNLGLTSIEAESRLKQYGLNELKNERKKSLIFTFLSIFKEPMITLLVFASIIYLFLGDTIESIFTFLMISFVLAIELIQRFRTENALQKLRDGSSQKSYVLRDGIKKQIDSKLIVFGDVVILSEGDKVTADGIVVESNSCEINEALLTGESLPVIKHKNDKVYSGTYVNSGSLIFIVEKTSNETEIGKIGKSINEVVELDTKMQKETRVLTKNIAIISISLSIFYIVYFGFITGEWVRNLLQGIAISMSLLPEEFPVVLTIFVALGAFRISKKHVLTRNMPTIETLGSTTVLCVDKTGTLTENKMEIVDIYSKEISNKGQKDVVNIASLACAPNSSDPMEKSILNYAKIKIKYNNLVKHIPLTKDSMYMANVWKDGNKYLFTVKGALEDVLKLVKDSQSNQLIQDCATLYMQKGGRVIAVASAITTKDFDRLEEVNFKLLGLLIFKDPIKAGVKNAINLCKNAGIKVVMITGDHPITAINIANEINLDYTENVITGDYIDKTDITELAFKLKTTSICARIKPLQKLKIVQALQKNGEIVAMTGDGINDAPALKAANMGISMGKRGTDVARESSDMVLMDDNFSSIVNAIKEGRRIYLNIKRASGFILAIHVPLGVFSLLPPFLGIPILLTPIHIMLLELVIDPVCSIVFEANEGDKNIMNIPPRDPKEKLFSSSLIIYSLSMGLLVSFFIMFLYFYNTYTDINSSLLKIQTLVFSAIMLCNIALIVIMYNYGKKLMDIKYLFRKQFLITLLMVNMLIFLLPKFEFTATLLSMQSLTLNSYLNIVIGSFIIIILGIVTPKIFTKH